MNATVSRVVSEEVHVSADNVTLIGDLWVPPGSRGIVLFAHGSGSSRHSARNRFVAGQLHERRLATLLIDLLTPEEEELDQNSGSLPFEIDMLSRRLMGATDWLAAQPQTRALPLGYFGASTGAAAAIVCAGRRQERVRAFVSRGGRPDLAGDTLHLVRSPTLLIVGSMDVPVVKLNREAAKHLLVPHKMEVIPGATHLFEEPGALERVADLAGCWFEKYLP
jgi:pimeloyl-ACP methyl ester carboxylesterase